MYTLHCTKKLIDRIKPAVVASSSPPTTALGNWYATALFWKPQAALLVNERTLLPVLMPLAPASTLTARFVDELANVLSRHGASQPFIANEVAAMSEVSMAKTSNRSVVGTMNEFAFLAEAYRESVDSFDLVALSMRLADTPCSAIKHNSPMRLIRDLIGASAHWK
jgi:hypothetical protein